MILTARKAMARRMATVLTTHMMIYTVVDTRTIWIRIVVESGVGRPPEKYHIMTADLKFTHVKINEVKVTST